jgi:hypothetical protein
MAEKIINKAYHRAEVIMNSSKLTNILNKNKLNDVDKLSSFVFRQLDKKLKVDYSIINNDDAYDSLDDDDNDISDESCDINLNKCTEDSSDKDEQEQHHLTMSKQIFQGMNIYKKINPEKMTS